MSTKKITRKSATSTTASGKTANVWTDEEKAAMRAIAKERKAEERAKNDRAAGESAALEAIKAMQGLDRSMAKRIHEIIKDSAPTLMPKTWYGMPAYANQDGNVVCFFQCASKFKARYATFGFNGSANLDEGNMWPVAFALKELTTADEARISALVKKAVS